MHKSFLFLAVLFFGHALALGNAVDDAALERRVLAFSEELRCLVCQNQSLADSHAGLAIDLKNQVREQFKRGASEKEIVAFMTERYGDFVLYRPPVKATTWLLWFGPGILMMAGLLALYFRLRRHAATTPDAELTAEERAHVVTLLGNKNE